MFCDTVLHMKEVFNFSCTLFSCGSNSTHSPNIYFSERPYCIHCLQYLPSTNLTQVLEHCQTCVDMTRPDPFRHRFVCYACSYFTYRHSNIKMHVCAHLGEKPFACEVCDYRAIAKQSLLLHRARRHSKFQNPVSTRELLMNFANKSKLNQSTKRTT